MYSVRPRWKFGCLPVSTLSGRCLGWSLSECVNGFGRSCDEGIGSWAGGVVWGVVGVGVLDGVCRVCFGRAELRDQFGEAVCVAVECGRSAGLYGGDLE